MKKKESKLKRTEQNILKKALLFAKEKPFFVLVVNVFLLSILVIQLSLIQSPISDGSQRLDDANQARYAYENNNLLIDEYLQSIDAQLQQPDQVALDIAYLNSIKDDLIWLKSTQDTVYHSKPSADAPIKELAFHMFMQIVLQINNDFTVDVGEPSYQERINAALKMDSNNQALVSDEDLRAGLATEHDVQAFKETQDSLFSNYITLKKTLAANADTIERRYVESKKLTWLSYSDTDIDYSDGPLDTNLDYTDVNTDLTGLGSN
jgi:hypothetical protein